MSKREQNRQLSDSSIDEIIAGIFFSKRYTGQFNNRDEMTELELDINPPDMSGPGATGKDFWNDGIVHDFDDPEETIEHK